MDTRIGLMLLGWLVGWWLLWRAPRLSLAAAARPPMADDTRRARAQACSVIIPARDEEASLGNLLGSLARQRFVPGEVIVVDDQSRDSTAAIARAAGGGALRVTVVDGEAVPVGWTGKAWACHQGAARATGTWLVFLDADVVLADGAFDALVRCTAHDRGLRSVQPFHRMRRTYERLSALFNIIGMMGVGAASLRPVRPAHGAFGPCLVTSRTDYDLVGGHREVRDAIVDDIALARRYRDAHLPVEVFAGRELISFRMYPEGLRQLIEGWSKNMATGAGSVAHGRLVPIACWIACLLLSVQTLVELALGRSGTSAYFALLLYFAFVVQWAVMLNQLGNFGWPTAVAYPVPLAVFVLVFARSAYLTLVRRRVVWRGRAIPLARGARDGAAAWR